MKTINWGYWPIWVVFGLCAALLAQGVNHIPLILWDESLYSTNAIEMLYLNRWEIHYYDGMVDYYNLKPPFFTWLRAGSFALFGFDLWVHRLPSVIASLFTVASLGYVLHRLGFNKKWIAFGMVLLTIAPAYNTLHVVKGGEYDAMLCLAQWLFFACFIKALASDAIKWRLLSVVCLGLAFYTKSLAGLFFIPGALLCVGLYRPAWFLEKRNYWLILLFLAFPTVYYFIIHVGHPEYLKEIYKHHFTRYGNTLNDVAQPFFYYLLSPSVLPFYVPALLLTFYVKYKRQSIQRWIYVGQIFVLSFLILISFSATKHGFYTAPIFSVACAVLVGLLHRLFLLFSKNSLRLANVLLSTFCIVGLHFTFAKGQNYIRYYNRAFHKTYIQQFVAGNFLMEPCEGEVNFGEDPRIYFGESKKWLAEKGIDSLTVFADDLHIPNTKGYNPHLTFYINYWRWVENRTVVLEENVMELQANAIVLCCNTERLEILEKHFRFNVLKDGKHCRLLQLEAKK